jgi:tetratricopeptide (TPR) repeat protein
MHATVRGLLVLISSLAVAADTRLPDDSEHHCPGLDAVSAPTKIAAACEREAGDLAETAHHPDLAEVHYRRAHALWALLAPNFIAEDAATLLNLGEVYASQAKTADAENTLNQALALARQVTLDQPRLSIVAADRLGAFYTQTGLPERGRPLLDEAIAKLRTPALASLSELAYACNALGMADLWARSYISAESYLREAVADASQAFGEDNAETAIYQANLAVTLFLRGQNDRAEILLHRARFVIAKTLSADSLPLGKVLAALASVETALGEFTSAEADARQSLAILSRLCDSQSLEVISGKVLLGTLFLRERKTPEAALIFPDAVAAERRLAQNPRAINPRVLADGIRRLGQLRAQQHDWHAAETLYRESLRIFEASLAPADPALAPVLTEYVNVLKHSGAPRAEVRSIEARAKAIKS